MPCTADVTPHGWVLRAHQCYSSGRNSPHTADSYEAAVLQGAVLCVFGYVGVWEMKWRLPCLAAIPQQLYHTCIDIWCLSSTFTTAVLCSAVFPAVFATSRLQQAMFLVQPDISPTYAQ